MLDACLNILSRESTSALLCLLNKVHNEILEHDLVRVYLLLVLQEPLNMVHLLANIARGILNFLNDLMVWLV